MINASLLVLLAFATLVQMSMLATMPRDIAGVFLKGLDVTKGSVEIGLDNSTMSRGSDNRSAHDQSIDYGLNGGGYLR